MATQALADPTAWNVVESLTTEVGPRPVGSPAMARARDWGVAKLKALGFENVHVEPFTTTRLVARGAEAAEVVAPWPQKLQILGLGGSVADAAGRADGADRAVPHLPGHARPAARRRWPARSPWSPSRCAAPRTAPATARSTPSATQGPVEAAKRGAVGYLIRSLSTDDTRLPHAGGGDGRRASRPRRCRRPTPNCSTTWRRAASR